MYPETFSFCPFNRSRFGLSDRFYRFYHGRCETRNFVRVYPYSLSISIRVIFIEEILEKVKIANLKREKLKICNLNLILRLLSSHVKVLFFIGWKYIAAHLFRERTLLHFFLLWKRETRQANLQRAIYFRRMERSVANLRGAGCAEQRWKSLELSCKKILALDHCTGELFSRKSNSLDGLFQVQEHRPSWPTWGGGMISFLLFWEEMEMDFL